ncbi:hypothetical protein [Lentzea albidocapillata]|uniref:Uncharacterized protein n=1 Tax=Lentzea albidocapillata TaxID=40571 RepID=A0A1W2AG20_9PSEU|nr:hypothetical protein [Lentzea albidocapillata]SMC59626.1 hypothetical protein SAMN05660733_00669 [Lentzea albidocapillata]
MADWLTRYRNGQRHVVWQELALLGDVRRSGRLEEAQAVCDEMAHRARQNVELIVERLTADGFLFHDNDDEQTPARPHTPPTTEAAAHVEWMEERLGAVPLTLSSWTRIVGDVWLVGTHPRWQTSAGSDPLVVEVEGSRCSDASLRRYVEDEWQMWQEDGSAGVFVLPLSPDHLHKDNTSGGDPYGVVLPDRRVDGLFSWENGMTPFVSYLNRAFQTGGFPMADGEEADAREVTSRLAQDLLPL